MDFIILKNKYYKGVIKVHKYCHTNIKLHSSIDMVERQLLPGSAIAALPLTSLFWTRPWTSTACSVKQGV